MSTPSDLERQARQLADSLTEALRPVTEGIRAAVAPLTVDPRLKAGAIQRELIRDQLREVVGFTEQDDSSDAVAQNELAQERLDAILAFIDLAKGHSLPRKLLPRGDRPGQEFTPGEIVTVMGLHRGVIEPPYDEVRVKLDAGPRSAWPSWAIAREGEQWTPPSSTPH
jgi:hypothetical protein